MDAPEEEQFQELLTKLAVIYAMIVGLLQQFPLPIRISPIISGESPAVTIAPLYDALELVEISPIGEETAEAVMVAIHLWIIAFDQVLKFGAGPHDGRFTTADIALQFALGAAEGAEEDFITERDAPGGEENRE